MSDLDDVSAAVKARSPRTSRRGMSRNAKLLTGITIACVLAGHVALYELFTRKLLHRRAEQAQSSRIDETAPRWIPQPVAAAEDRSDGDAPAASQASAADAPATSIFDNQGLASKPAVSQPAGRITVARGDRSDHAPTVATHVGNGAASVTGAPALESGKIALPTKESGTVDLLELVDLDRDVISGRWRREKDSVRSEGDYQSRFAVPYRPPAEYDLWAEFTTTQLGRYGDVNMMAATDGRPLLASMGTNEGFALSNVNGCLFGGNPTFVTRTGILTVGQRHHAALEVRSGSIRMLVDGQQITQWKPADGAIEYDGVWAIGADALGFGSNNQITLHALGLREVSGPGRRIGRLAPTRIGKTIMDLPPVGAAISLVDLEPRVAQVGYGQLMRNDCGDERVVAVNGKACTRYLFAHADSSLIYDIPKGAIGFRATALSISRNMTMRCFIYVDGNEAVVSRPLSDTDGQVGVQLPFPSDAHRIELRFTAPVITSAHSIWANPEFLMPAHSPAPVAEAGASPPPPTSPPGGATTRDAGPSPGAPAAARTVVFVCQASGSMLPKMASLKNLLKKAVGALKPTQSFGIIFFPGNKCTFTSNGGAGPMQPALVASTAESKNNAYALIDDTTPAGANDPIPALTLAFELHPQIVYILSNGEFPDKDKVRENVAKLNSEHKVRVNTVGFVNSLKTSSADCLQEIAKDSQGTWKLVAEADLGVGGQASGVSDAKPDPPVASAGVPPSSRPTDGPVASSDVPMLVQAKSLMRDQKYTGALVPLRHLMSLQGHDADAFSRHEVLMLVAECQLQLHQVPESLRILDVAAREANSRNDWPQKAEALALEAILRMAPKLTYAPRAGDDHAPLNLTDAGERQTAFKRLYDEKLAFCEQQQRTASEGASLQPLLDTAAAFATCRALEEVTANGTTRSDAMGDELADWSSRLIAATLASLNKRIDAIVFDSNVGMKGRTRPGRAGLSADQRQELLEMDAECQKVPGAIAALNEAFARPLPTASPKNQTDAKNTSTRVEAIVSADGLIVKNRK